MSSRVRRTTQNIFLCALSAACVLPRAAADAAEPAAPAAGPATGTPAAAATDNAAPTPLSPLTISGSPLVDSGAFNLDQPNSTASRLNLTPLETPGSVQIITGDTIRDRGDRTILDAVGRATGITTFPTPGNGNAALSARGFAGVTSVMQLYDGTQLYVGAGTVTFPFDPWTVDRIEVLSGPASVLYGQGAIGGVVNVIPRRPDPTNPSTTGQFTLGSYDTYREAVDATGPLGRYGAYRLDVSHSDSDGWVDHGRSSSTALSGSFRFEPTDDLRITISEDYGDQWPMQYFGTPLIDGNLLTSMRNLNYNVSDSTIHWVDSWTQVRTEWTPTDGVTVHNDLYYLGSDRHWREDEGYLYVPAKGVIQRSTFLEIYHHEQQYGDHGDVTLSGLIAGHRNDFAVGFDENQIDFRDTSDSPYSGSSTVPVFGFTPGDFIDVSGVKPQFHTATQQYALYAEDRLKLTDSWSLVAGLRHDTYDLNRFGYVPTPTVTDADLSNTSWRVGTVYEVIPNLALYAQYATATDPISSLITLSPTQAGYSLATGRQIEVGVKQDFWSGHGEWTFAGYDIVKHNILTANPMNPALSEQVGEQSSRGLEAATSVQLGGGWRIMANGTLLQARFDNFSSSVGGVLTSAAGKVPPNVPERAANLWLDWAFVPGWSAGAGVRYVGHRYADNFNTLELPGYTVVDLALHWRPLERLHFDLHIYNAFDTLYAAAPYNGGTQWILGEPLAVEATAGITF
jgi:iron complex outermembrane receptor protein